jgi:hypothetical protein
MGRMGNLGNRVIYAAEAHSNGETQKCLGSSGLEWLEGRWARRAGFSAQGDK